jgi:hypothetical protein
MKLYDLLWQVAEKLSKGRETEWLYEYFLHTSVDRGGYITTADYWSTKPMLLDREIPDIDMAWVFFNYKFNGGCTSFVADAEGKTTTKMILFYVPDGQVNKKLAEDRKMGCSLRLLPKQNIYKIRIDQGNTVGTVSNQAKQQKQRR